MPLRALALVALGLLRQVSALTFASTGQTVVLDGIYFYLPADPVIVLAPENTLSRKAAGTGGITPLTVVTANSTLYTSKDLAATIKTYKDSDDVYTEGFLEAIYVQYTSPQPRGYSTPKFGNTTNGTSEVLVSYVSNATMIIPPGPYFISSAGAVYQAWRLYSDLAGAFTESVLAKPNGDFMVLPAGMPGQHLAIAVPSRLYYTKTAEKPLAGVRLGIKDIYDIAGLRTGNGNRAWYHLYSEATVHATPVQRLVDAGAVIVGKMVTSQFANGEEATRVGGESKARYVRGIYVLTPSCLSSGLG